MDNSRQNPYATHDYLYSLLPPYPPIDNDADTDVSNFDVQYLQPQSQEASAFPPSIRFAARPRHVNNLVAECIIYLQLITDRCPNPSYTDITHGVFRSVSLIIRDDVIREPRVWEAVSGMAQENDSDLYRYDTPDDPLIPSTFLFNLITDRHRNRIRLNIFVERRQLNPTHVINVRYTFRSIGNNGDQGLEDGDVVSYINERILTSIYGSRIQRLVLPQAEDMIVWRYFNAALATNNESDVN